MEGTDPQSLNPDASTQDLGVDPMPNVVLSPLRTYKSDINQTVQSDKITTAKVFIAEQKNRQVDSVEEVTENSIKKPKNILLLALGLLLVLAAVGGVGYVGYTKLAQNMAPVTIAPASFFLFAFDQQELIEVVRDTNLVREKVSSILGNALQTKDNTYTDLVFYTEVRNANQSQNVRITSGDFFGLFGIRPPVAISQSVSKDFVYGFYKSGMVVEPFVVVGLSDYENAYASMFAWEPTLALDMKVFFPNLQKIFEANMPVSEGGAIASTTMATSTVVSSSTVTDLSTTTAPVAATSDVTSTYAPANRNVQFFDMVLSNRDTRALRDVTGNPYFYYTFIDKDKILFAQDPKLIAEILRKIREKELVR